MLRLRRPRADPCPESRDTEPEPTREWVRRRALVVALVAIPAAALVAVNSSHPMPESPPAGASPTPVVSETQPPETSSILTEELAEGTVEPDPGASPTTTLPPPRPGPPVWPSTGAQAKHGRAVTIYRSAKGKALRTLTDPWGAIPAHPAFRVLRQAGEWLEVSLPVRPNESTGWIRAEDVNQYTTNLSIDIDIDARWLTVYDRNQVVISVAIVVGTPYTPTPSGSFFVSDLIPNPGGPFGTFALGLSAHSNVLTEFAGGDGQVAMHGTNQPQLMGTASSHGCVRVPNNVASRLGPASTVGIPVRMHHG